MTAKALQRLATAVKQRRAELGLAQGDLSGRGGPSIVTVGQIERGQIEKPQASTLSRLDKALRWAPGTAAAVLAGAKAPTVGPGNDDGSHVTHSRADDIPARVTDDELLAMIRQQRTQLDEIERRLRERSMGSA